MLHASCVHCQRRSPPLPHRCSLTVPAEPQEEDAEQCEGGIVAGHVDGVARGVKAANAGAQHPGGGEGGEAAHLQ